MLHQLRFTGCIKSRYHILKNNMEINQYTEKEDQLQLSTTKAIVSLINADPTEVD